MAKQKIRSDMIVRLLGKRHSEDAFFTEVKNGPTQFSSNLLRLDALAIKKSWANPCLTAYEIKVSRSDFVGDNKWPGYLSLCHCFYFACPIGLIKPDELPPEVGLIYYNQDKDKLYTKRKALVRPIEMPWEMLYYVIMTRLEHEKHPFFSSQRDLLEAWVKDKEERVQLGYAVGSKMAKRIDELEDEVRNLKRSLERQNDEVELLKKIQQILERHGIRTYSWAMQDNLETALSSRIPLGTVEVLNNIIREANQLIGKFNTEDVVTMPG